MGKRRGRPRKSAEQKLKDALERTQPAEHILLRRQLFSFVRAPERLEGRNGEIDSEVCDGIGQLCALGYLEGHGCDPIELRDKGRFWGGHYAKLMKGSGLRIGQFERQDKGHGTGALSGADLLFDKMDGSLPSYERSVLLSLLVDSIIGSDPFGKDVCEWAKSLIHEGLLARGRTWFCEPVRFPTMHDRMLLDAAVRGLVILVDGAVPVRRAA